MLATQPIAGHVGKSRNRAIGSGSVQDFMRPANVLTLSEVAKSFDSDPVLKSVQLSVARGDVCAIVGPNGSGKSTVLRIACGLLRPDSGEVQLLQHASFNSSALRGQLGVAIGAPALWPHLSAIDHLRVSRMNAGKHSDAQSDGALLERLLLPTSRRRVRAFSSGMQRKLAIAIAVTAGSSLIILDEPSSGVDSESSAIVRSLIQEVARDRAVLMATHNARDLEVSTSAYRLVGGELVRFAIDQAHVSPTIVAPDESKISWE